MMVSAMMMMMIGRNSDLEETSRGSHVRLRYVCSLSNVGHVTRIFSLPAGKTSRLDGTVRCRC